MGVEQHIRTAIDAAIDELIECGDLCEEARGVSFVVQRTKHPEHGDLASNVGMVLAKIAKKKPLELAQLVGEELAHHPDVASFEVARPGFLNLRLQPSAFHTVLREIEYQKHAYGRAPAATGERVLVEFVSANPTGPLLISHGRGAIIGDAVARLLEATGNRVSREYYVNDFGNQVSLLAKSVWAIAHDKEIPEGGYGGEYVHVLAKWVVEHAPDLVQRAENDDQSVPSEELGAEVMAALGRLCVTKMLEGISGVQELGGIRATLGYLGIYFDNWFSEESLHRWGKVRSTLDSLQRAGRLVTLEDGAVAFSSDDGEDDKVRVLRKRDGATYTYFAGDLAYHRDKASRGYDRLINVLGADHHGYVARLRAGLGAFGFEKDRFEVLLYQLVKLLRDGQEVKMGKRLGNLITVDEVVEEIDVAAGRIGAGADALRYYYLSRRSDSPIVLDIEQAKKQSLDNPVFYLQYGHARLCGILRRARETFGLRVQRFSAEHGKKLTHPDELSMLMMLGAFPETVQQAAQERAPHRIIFFLQDISQAFQSYFTRLRNVERDAILPQSWQCEKPDWRETWDWDRTNARIAWVDAIRVVYETGLKMLGICAPERMFAPVSEDVADEGELLEPKSETDELAGNVRDDGRNGDAR